MSDLNEPPPRPDLLVADAGPGSVIVSAQSASRSRDQVYEVPMLDPAAQQSSTGGYPWRIEGGSSTFVYIKNVSEKEQQTIMGLF